MIIPSDGRDMIMLNKVSRLRDGGGDDVQHLLLALAHLVFQMNRRSRNEGVNAPALGLPHRFAAARDVGGDRAGKPGNRGVLRTARDFGDGLKVADRGDGGNRLR